MIQAICAFGIMCAVMVGVQVARVARARELEATDENASPEAAKILMLFEEAEQLNRAA